ncbi:hypothetical protein DUNSADRAFT_5188 [Dunaliella salina]|uniref:Uncharacterized protein n=1 Tax=Dunaliella salina TaxID=3046 RepID=A0ABQ7GQT0_DUNSA|nr:hypothetical protein DUNSADRAFT_5188 [Dunaliella salina]|eukprot:KAF5836959.1 hypothetical protein DUNSADRAFT_5188 [Dunaliella salina]
MQGVCRHQAIPSRLPSACKQTEGRRRHLIKCSAAPAQAKTTLALKEWAVACAALNRGEQTVLLRKGGIREPCFKPQGSSFFLFPTAFHSDVELLQPGVSGRYNEELALDPKALLGKELPIGTYAQVTGAWTVEGEEIVDALEGLHVWSKDFVKSRLSWRPKQPLTVLEIRAWRLAEPLQIKVHDELFGCFSFVDLQSAILDANLEGLMLEPALNDPTFAQKQEQLRAGLKGVRCSELRWD